MSIPTHEHIIEAVREAARSFPGGIKALAAEMDMAPGSLGNLLNPYADRQTVKLGLEQGLYIMHRTGNALALHLAAAELGYRLIPAHATPDHDVQGEMLDDVQKLAGYQKAIQDKAPRKTRLFALAQALDELLQTEAAVEGEGRKVREPQQ